MIYTEKHEVTFEINGEVKNSYNDWHLVPTLRPFIAPPTVQDFSTEISARMGGKIDYYKSIINYPIYNNRTGTLEFLIDHENPDYHIWHFTYDQIMNFLHGKYGKMVLLDQPDYYYEGRFTVDTFASNSDWSTITIAYDVWPMKKSIIDSLEPWLWDPFSFLTGIIRFGEDFKIKVPYNQTTEYTVKDVRGVSTVELDFSENSFGTDVQVGISYYEPIRSEQYNYREITLNNKNKEHRFTFILYPGHERFTVLAYNSIDFSASGEISVNIHFREGIL